MLNENFKSEEYLKAKETVFQTIDKCLYPLLQEENELHQNLYEAFQRDIQEIKYLVESTERSASFAVWKDDKLENIV